MDELSFKKGINDIPYVNIKTPVFQIPYYGIKTDFFV